jgi:hypothetical protein
LQFGDSVGGMQMSQTLTICVLMMEQVSAPVSVVSCRTVSCCNVSLLFFIWIKTLLKIIVFLWRDRGLVFKSFIRVESSETEPVSEWETQKQKLHHDTEKNKSKNGIVVACRSSEDIWRWKKRAQKIRRAMAARLKSEAVCQPEPEVS